MKVPRRMQVVSALVFAAASVVATVADRKGQASGRPPAHKLALLIGIDKYRDPSVPTLSGCKNDVANWDDLLTKKFGFEPGDILKLTDEQATKAAVKDAFAKHLAARATADTVVVIAISSHGTQVLDQNGDEPDGLDESVILHDSKIAGADAPGSQLIDDEINDLITDLNRKTQHVVLIADSCFSGTLAREAGAARLVPVSETVRQQAAELVAKKRSFVSDQPESIKPTEAGGARYVLISATKSDETAHEKSFDGKTNGAMTWFLTSELRKAADDATYKDVFDKVRFDVATAFPGQHPDIEGAEQETAIFGLNPVAGDRYLAVESVQGSNVTLGGGQVHGIGVGSRFGIFPPGTRSPKGATPLATAVVKSVALTTSQAELTPGAAPIPGAARAFPSAYVVPIHRAKVFVPSAPAVVAKVRAGLQNNPAVELVDRDKDYDLRVVLDTGRQALVLQGGSQEPLTDPLPEASANAAATMVEKVASWARWLNVRNLSNPSAALAVSFKLVRQANQSVAKASDNDLTRLIVGERFDLKIENREDRPLYFNLLDLSSTGQITVSYPAPGVDAFVKPHDTWQVRFKATLQKGFDYDRDTAKLVVSTRPLDLRFLEQGFVRAGLRGEQGVSSILADLVGKTAFGSPTRGFEQDTDVADQWTTSDLVFEVQPEVSEKEQSLIKTCYDRLPSFGLQWQKTKAMRGVVDPIRVEPQVGGITFRNMLGKAAPMYMSCLFAERVAKFARAAAALGVTEVQHLGIYNYRCIGGGSPDGRACKVSQHAYGRAIDFASFKTSKGVFVVKSDWTKRPPPTCSATGGSDKDKYLRKLACEAGRSAGFNIMLTPNYNAAHRDHFHFDGTPNASFVRGGEIAASGTDPAAADLGD